MQDGFVGWLRDAVARRDPSDPLSALVAAYADSELLDKDLDNAAVLLARLRSRTATVREPRQLGAAIVRYAEDLQRYGAGVVPSIAALLAAIDDHGRTGTPMDVAVCADVKACLDDMCADDRELDRSSSAFWLAELALLYAAGTSDARATCESLLGTLHSLIVQIVGDCFALDSKQETSMVALIHRITLDRLLADCDDIDAGRWI
jgi:hypothetical protein